MTSPPSRDAAVWWGARGHGGSCVQLPQSEAEQIVQALRAKGRDAWYLLGLNEGHGFQKKENRDYMTAAVLLFFRQKLLGPGS